MQEPPKAIEQLIALMARIPGLGPRSARRAVLEMIRKRERLLDPLVHAIGEVAGSVRDCLICGNIGEGDRCAICLDPKRQAGVLCVVESVADLWAMERAGAFKGRYHVLGGTLSALDGVTPDDLKIPQMLRRVVDEEITEVILALNATIDGQTTMHVITDALAPMGVTVTSLAKGVPIGGELDYLDDSTIQAAMQARSSV
jgi:recombination protein RecR